MPRLMSRGLVKWVGVGTLSLSGVGCVSQEMYDAMKMQNGQQAEQIATDTITIKQKEAELQAAQASLASAKGSQDTNGAQVGNLLAQNASLTQENSELNAKIQHLIQIVGSQAGTALPENLTSQLTDFAAQNPDAIEFDSAHGTVKFKSDVTFASGDATVTPKVKEVLARFASILNKSGADQYDLLIEGHTDNQPVSSAAAKAAGHKDNWYLSAHRAIAVKQELVADAVSSKRIGVVGFADQRPLTSNGTDAGRAKNRRVEVVILPSSHAAGGGGGAVTSSDDSAPTSSRKPKPVAETGGSHTIAGGGMNK